MGSDRIRPIDEVTAERMLAGHNVGPPHLADLLNRAAGPMSARELSGEEAALAAFRSAHVASPGFSRRPPTRPAWARLLTVKVGALGVALAAGGVALAAGTGLLPNPLRVDTTSQAPFGPPGTSAYVSGAAPTTTGPGASPSTTTTVNASLDGLCRAYLAQIAEHPGNGVDSTAFGTLIAAAGGEGKVTAFCEALLPSPSKSARPTGPPSPHPTGPPTSHPGPKKS